MTDTTASATAVTHDSITESAADTTGYSADQAAMVFGIPRIAPIVTPRLGNLLPTGSPHTSSAAFAAPGEDLTESLTADERDAAAGFAEHARQKLPTEVSVGAVLDDPVTAALRVPSNRVATPADWDPAPRQPLTERLVVPIGRPPAAVSQPAPRTTAVLPHLGRGPGEAATTTLTLPPAAGKVALVPNAAANSGLARPAQIAKWALLGAGTALLLLGAVLAGHALTLADMWPGAAAPPPSRPPAVYRERLLEQATTALRDGRREQAVGLLLRYQASEPAGSVDRTVEIMLRGLKKDLGTLAR